MVGSPLLRQKIDILMGIDRALFSVDLFSYRYENEYLSGPISND